MIISMSILCWIGFIIVISIPGSLTAIYASEYLIQSSGNAY